jgi:hypothetical protein
VGRSLRYDLGGGHPLVGRSAPDFELADGRRLGELLANGKGLLLDFDAAAASSACKPLERSDHLCRKRRQGSAGLSAVLVRPDGFVAWAGETPPIMRKLLRPRRDGSASVPGPANAAYYRRRAEGGVGLILSEGTVVDRPASRNDPGVPFFHGTAALAGWQGVIDQVHDAGGRMGPQLWHTGAVKSFQTDWTADAPVESPSGLDAPGVERGVAMSDAAIADTIAAFAKAAAEAKRLGFDTVELHGAHGYLIDQYFWAGTNRRDDRYGGAGIGERSRSNCHQEASSGWIQGVMDLAMALRMTMILRMQATTATLPGL